MINLTQHQPTPEQEKAGVYTPEASRGEVLALLNFNSLPEYDEVLKRASAVADIAKQHMAKEAMIGGAPFLMGRLEIELMARGITPVYAFSVRESVETKNADGSVSKNNVFRHAGFIKVA
jgi:hypothetical protein